MSKVGAHPSGARKRAASPVREARGQYRVPKPGAAHAIVVDDFLAAHHQVSKGVPNRKLAVLLGLLQQPVADVASYLGLSPSTMRRYMAKPSAMLPVAVGARVATLDRLWSHALRTFGSEDAARDWLGTEQPALDYAVPAALLTTEQGCAAVDELLGRIEHGVFT